MRAYGRVLLCSGKFLSWTAGLREQQMAHNCLDIQFCISTKSPKCLKWAEFIFSFLKRHFAKEISICLVLQEILEFRIRFRDWWLWISWFPKGIWITASLSRSPPPPSFCTIYTLETITQKSLEPCISSSSHNGISQCLPRLCLKSGKSDLKGKYV